MKATIDNHKVIFLEPYRMQTPWLYFLQPTGDPYLGVEEYSVPELVGWTYAYVVSDGYWLLIKPLSKGKHEFIFRHK